MRGQGMEEVQLALFSNLENSYSIENLRDKCYLEIKKKYKKPMDCESFDDFCQFIEDETDLLYAYKLKEIAERIENRIYGEQKKIIDQAYLTKGVYSDSI